MSKYKGFILISVIGVLGLLLNSYLISSTKSDVITVVIGKERITYSSGNTIESKYLVYTEAEVFECTDQLLTGKFNSSDVYGQLEKGKKYKFTVYGVRIPFMSSYRNIIGVKEL
ncbi:TPA: hypothetical protein ACG0AB_000772 [Elizabethkingia anophelis]